MIKPLKFAFGAICLFSLFCWFIYLNQSEYISDEVDFTRNVEDPRNVNRYAAEGEEGMKSDSNISKVKGNIDFSPSCPLDARFHLKSSEPKPDFFMVGVAKGGTTSFSNYLPTHPNVNTISIKEPNFFTWRYRTIETYQNMFTNIHPISNTDPDLIISGEYTTSYILHPLTPKRVFTELPNTKIIMILRNPIDRAYSHYTMSVRAKIETLSFEDIIEREMSEIIALREKAHDCFYNNPECDPAACFPSSPLLRHDVDRTQFYMNTESDMKDYYYVSYLFRSIYDDSVERWFSVFPSDQILVLSSEELFEDSARELKKTAAFLGIPYFDFDNEIMDKSWGGGASNQFEKPHDYPPISDKTREQLRTFFEPYNRKLYAFLDRDFGWE